jgi:excisionase family DNA binding protein
MNSELEPVLLAARTLPPSELPRLLGDLAEIAATAQARLIAQAPVLQPDTLLTCKQAAARLSCSVDYLYKQGRELPFARRLGRKLLFSQNGIEEYLRKKL